MQTIFKTVLVSLIICCMWPSPSSSYADNYRALYVGDVQIGDTVQNVYVGEDSSGPIHYHAYTLNATAGQILTIDFLKSDTTPQEHPSLDILKLEDLNVVLPGPGDTFTYQYDFHNFVIWGSERMGEAGHVMIEEWEVPQTTTYLLMFSFYPYNSRGAYSLSIENGAVGSSSQAENSTTGWKGEFPLDETGSHVVERGAIEFGKEWAAHTFQLNAGEIVTIIVIGYRDTNHQQLVPQARLFYGGWDQDMDEVPLAICAAADQFCTINYRVPSNIPEDTDYTVVVSSDDNNFGDYYLWAAISSHRFARLDYTSGFTGELFQQAGGTYRFNGNLTDDRAFTVHSLRVNPGDSILATLTSDSMFMQPVLMLVPGGFTAHEPWLAFELGDGERCQLTFTVPTRVPPDSLFTFVITDISNIDYLLLGGEPEYGFGGEYTLQILVSQ